MKKVSISEALLKEYSDKELVAFIASQLNSMANVKSAPGQEAFVLGELTIWLDDVSGVAKALNERMNGKSTSIVV